MTVEQLIWLKGYLILGWLLGFFCWERFVSATGQSRWMVTRQRVFRLGRNMGLWLINTAVSPLVVLPLTLWAVDHQLMWRPQWLQEWWQGGSGLLLDLLLLDLWIYWWHRLNHRLPLLWRFHRIHHLDQQLDSTSALRFHVGEVLLSAVVRGGVIYVLSIPLLSVVVFEILLMLCAIFHHSDIRLWKNTETVLSKVIVTPGIHWVHHHAQRADTDSNYATILSCWDRLFGSFSTYRRHRNMPIGVASEAELSFKGLLVAPFRRALKDREGSYKGEASCKGEASYKGEASDNE